MSIINRKIRISEIKHIKTSDTARYSINYGISKSAERQRQNSHAIISALKMQSDLLLYIDSLMFNALSKQREASILSFLKFLESKGLKHRYRKASETVSPSFLEKIVSSNCKTVDSHKIYCFIPDDIWMSDEFIFALPLHGIKYYLCCGSIDKEALLEAIYEGTLSKEEENSFFKLSVFDFCSFGQMGVYTDSLSIEQLKSILDV